MLVSFKSAHFQAFPHIRMEIVLHRIIAPRNGAVHPQAKCLRTGCHPGRVGEAEVEAVRDIHSRYDL